jgi:hypothetical protein
MSNTLEYVGIKYPKDERVRTIKVLRGYTEYPISNDEQLILQLYEESNSLRNQLAEAQFKITQVLKPAMQHLESLNKVREEMLAEAQEELAALNAQEPVAWMYEHLNSPEVVISKPTIFPKFFEPSNVRPLYAQPMPAPEGYQLVPDFINYEMARILSDTKDGCEISGAWAVDLAKDKWARLLTAAKDK